jgi:hypothetical protein
MGDINIRFRFNTTTGKKEIVIEYESEDDRLPVEHERRHRQIVEQLVGQGVLKPDEASGVKVERVRPQTKNDPKPNEPRPNEPVKT